MSMSSALWIVYVDAVRTALRGISWNFTAIGTVLLAAATVGILIYTVMSTRRDRRDAEDRAERDRQAAEDRAERDREDAKNRASRDRADAERRLQEERDLSERRIREERAEAAEIRRRDAQRVNAIDLVRRVAQVQPLMANVPSLALREGAGTSPWAAGAFPGGPRDAECRSAIESLRHGAWTEVVLLGDGDAARKAGERYRLLVRLVDQATLTAERRDRDIDTMLNYATWVRISLRMLADNETVPEIVGGPDQPVLGMAEHMPLWAPEPRPPGWDDELEVNAPLRRSSRANFGA